MRPAVRTGDLIAALGRTGALHRGPRVVIVYNAALGSNCNREAPPRAPQRGLPRYPRSPTPTSPATYIHPHAGR